MALNDFVKGTLSLNHMADHPLKVMPPKFCQEGKQIKVRVFSVDKRAIEFTKKDSLLKDKAPVYSQISEVRQGSKVLGLVVGEADHGYVIKTFGGLKGLLTFADVKANSALIKGELKSGSIVKAFVLFVKKGSGMALTLNKKTARKG